MTLAFRSQSDSTLVLSARVKHFLHLTAESRPRDDFSWSPDSPLNNIYRFQASTHHTDLRGPESLATDLSQTHLFHPFTRSLGAGHDP